MEENKNDKFIAISANWKSESGQNFDKTIKLYSYLNINDESDINLDDIKEKIIKNFEIKEHNLSIGYKLKDVVVNILDNESVIEYFKKYHNFLDLN